MKSKWLVSLLAVVPAVWMPLAATSQDVPDATKTAPAAERTYKYEAFAGFSYTSLNQVNQSRYGLIGANVEVSRNFGRFFALTGDAAYYPSSYASGNPGKPTVSMILAGPEVHGPILDRLSVFAHALLGGAHTGGEGMNPSISFAGGAGVGMEYQMTPRWGIRAWGDSIASSFTVANSDGTGNSPHMRRNARASIGVGYRF